MSKRWLQVKGDLSVRAFLFQQSRQTSLFDENIDQAHQVIQIMCPNKGAFHVKAHYSSSHLICWFHDDAYNYKAYVKEEVLVTNLLDSFPALSYEGRKLNIGQHQIGRIFDEFKRLRFSDEQIYLLSASVNKLNGMIGMNFSCDSSHDIEHDEFIRRLREFGAADQEDNISCTSSYPDQ